MATYASYHRHPVNKALHFVGVPAIVWGLMVWLAIPGPWPVGAVALTPAHAAVALLLVYFLRLDFAFGVASVLAFTLLLVGALEVAMRPAGEAAVVGAVALAGGWAVQLIGHAVWEKRRPALADNLFQVFVAPLFLVAETAFALGLRPELRKQVFRPDA